MTPNLKRILPGTVPKEVIDNFNQLAEYFKSLDGGGGAAAGSVTAPEVLQHVAERHGNPHGTVHSQILGIEQAADDSSDTSGGKHVSDSLVKKYEDHRTASSGVHGVTGNVVGTSDSQVITNKKFGGADHYGEFEDDGTLVLHGDATGHVDIFFPHGLPKTTGPGNPSLATYLGNLRGYAYAVGDAHDFDPQEYYHQCEVGAPIIWHLHWLSRTDVAAARTVKWELERSYAGPSGVETVISPNVTVEVTVPANTPAATMFITDVVTDTITGIGPVWMLSARIKRIASSGTEPATDPIIKALHAHAKIDTPAGSRQAMSK